MIRRRVGDLAGIDGVQFGERTVLLLDDLNRQRPVLVDVPPDLVARFEPGTVTE